MNKYKIITTMLQLSTILMRLFGYPYNNDLVICKDSPDYLTLNYKIMIN